MYSAPYGMGQFWKTWLNIRHFYTNYNFYWLLGKIPPSWIRNKSNFWKKLLFGEVIRERNILPLRTQYILPDTMVRCTYIWRHQKFYVHVIICVGLLCRSLLLRIQPNTGQTPGTTDKTERRKIWISMKGGPFCPFTLWRLSIVVYRVRHVQASLKWAYAQNK